MAKISKKPPSALTAFEINDITGLLAGGAGEAVSGTEPIVQIPNVDIFSTSGKLVIEVEMPGVRKEDVEIVLTGGTIAVKALKFECFEDNRINYVCMERVFGKVFREIDIPFTVDTSKLQAVYKNGVLTITVPRIKDKRSASRRIPIETEYQD